MFEIPLKSVKVINSVLLEKRKCNHFSASEAEDLNEKLDQSANLIIASNAFFFVGGLLCFGLFCFKKLWPLVWVMCTVAALELVGGKTNSAKILLSLCF